MRVLVFGSRDWRDREAIAMRMKDLPDGAVVVHGGASGADAIGGEEAARLGLDVEVYFAKWEEDGKVAGIIRNQQMLESKPDLAYGFRCPGKSHGTDDMMRRLMKAGITCHMMLAGVITA